MVIKYITVGYICYRGMEKLLKCKNFNHEKENQQKFVNKKTDLLSSLHNIKLPLQSSQNYKEKQFQSVPPINSL
jgi:hypothetical protein